jgi:hypothetical protein
MDLQVPLEQLVRMVLMVPLVPLEQLVRMVLMDQPVQLVLLEMME